MTFSLGIESFLTISLKSYLRLFTIKALIENGPVAIDNIQARLVSAAGITTTETIAPGKIGKAQSVQVIIPGEGVKQVKLTPYIIINREKEYCSNKAITYENIRTC